MGWITNRRMGVVALMSGCLTAVAGAGITNTASAQYQPQNYNTRNGALLGGVTGAVIGGVVGHQRDDATEGALLGGVAGAIAGGVLGNQRDHAQRQNSYYTQPVYAQPTYVQPTYVQPTYVRPTYVEHRTYVPVAPKPVSRRPVNASEVVNMTQSGVSDSVIVSHIQANGVASRPDVNEVIWMNQHGVSDYVITAMQQNGHTAVRSVPATVYRSSEVIVQEEYPQKTIITTPAYRPTSRPVYIDRRGF